MNIVIFMLVFIMVLALITYFVRFEGKYLLMVIVSLWLSIILKMFQIYKHAFLMDSFASCMTTIVSSWIIIALILLITVSLTVIHLKYIKKKEK